MNDVVGMTADLFWQIYAASGFISLTRNPAAEYVGQFITPSEAGNDSHQVKEFSLDMESVSKYGYGSDPKFSVGIYTNLSLALATVLDAPLMQIESWPNRLQLGLVAHLIDLDIDHESGQYDDIRQSVVTGLGRTTIELNTAIDCLQELKPGQSDYQNFEQDGDLDVLHNEREILLKSFAIHVQNYRIVDELLKTIENHQFEDPRTVAIAIWAFGRQNVKTGIAQLVKWLRPGGLPEHYYEPIEMAAQFLSSGSSLIPVSWAADSEPNDPAEYWAQIGDHLPDARDESAWAIRDAQSVFWEKRLRCAVEWSVQKEIKHLELVTAFQKDEVEPVNLWVSDFRLMGERIAAANKYPIESRHIATVLSINRHGIQVTLFSGGKGFIEFADLKSSKRTQTLKSGDLIAVQVLGIALGNQQGVLQLKQINPELWPVTPIKYEPGIQVAGIVKNIDEYGVFIEIGKGDVGLLNISELRRDQAARESRDVLQVGQISDCVIKSVHEVHNRTVINLALSARNVSAKDHTRDFHVGEVTKGRITKITRQGVNIEIEEGVEGLLPISELSEKKIGNPVDIFKIGDTLVVCVVQFDAVSGKATLSRKRITKNKLVAEKAKHGSNIDDEDTLPLFGLDDESLEFDENKRSGRSKGAKPLTVQQGNRVKVLRGVRKLANAVKVTLGPRGRNAIIDKSFGGPTVTKDGVTVAQEIDAEDKYEKMGAQLIRDVTSKALNGGKTATVLAEAIYGEGTKAIVAGTNPMLMKRGMDLATTRVIDNLRNNSILVTSKEQMESVAATAANNDRECGRIIADAFDKVGKDGVVVVETSQSKETTLTLVSGIQFDRGFESPYFVTDVDHFVCELDEPFVLIYGNKISSNKELVPLLEKVVSAAKPILIVCEDVDAESLATLVINKIRAVVQCALVKAPGYGERRRQILEDIAVVTGGKPLFENQGFKLDDVQLEELGRARKVKIDKDNTTIIEGYGKKDDIKGRVALIQKELEKSTSDYDKEKLSERMAKLSGGVAIISVAGAIESEAMEKKVRLENAIQATRAAIQEGILPGGGVALLRASEDLEAADLGHDEKLGFDIVARACKAPIKQIVENAGADGNAIAAKILKNKDKNFGFDVLQEKFGDLVKTGIIDSTKVVRSALTEAVSVATLLLTTEALVAEVADESASSSGADIL